MTLLKLNALFVNTDVLDVTETDMVEELLCLYPINQRIQYHKVGPNQLVSVQNANNKVWGAVCTKTKQNVLTYK